MWYGKLAIINFLFGLAILFSSFYINQIFNDPYISSNVTYQSLNSTMGTFQYNTKPDATLIFGDFMSVFTIIGNLMTGQIFSSALSLIQGAGLIDAGVSLLMGLLFDSSALFLLLYIVSNRSI